MKTIVMAVVLGIVGTGARLCAAPIHDAAKANDTATLAALLKAQPSLINTPDANGWTPLHWAASEGRTEAVKLLLANGADVDIQDIKRYRPVTYARDWGHKEVVDLLRGQAGKPGGKATPGDSQGEGEAGAVRQEYLGTAPRAVLSMVPSATTNGCRAALVGLEGNKPVVVVDGQWEPEYDDICRGSLTFSANGTRVAYGAVKGRKQLVVMDGQPGPEYDTIMCGPVFRPAGAVEYLAAKTEEGRQVLYRVNHPHR